MPDEMNGLSGLETLLSTLHNWFVVRGGKHAGSFSISSGVLDLPYLQIGQYYRIRGSVFNDGLHKYGQDDLTDEVFTGEVAALAIPHAVIALSGEIDDWRKKNPETDKTSESFGGYSYTRGGTGQSGQTASGWQAVFSSRMSRWRKPYEID